MLRTSFTPRALAVLAALAVLGCEAEMITDGSAGNGGGGTLSLLVVSGNNQTGPVGAQLAAPLVVKVVGAGNKPVKGQIVNFRVTAGGGSVFAGAALTNAQGLAQELWTLGTVAGAPQTVEARAVDPGTGAPVVFATFTATAVAGAPATVDVNPDSVGLAPGATAQLTATAADQYGNPIASPAFSWSSNDPSVATVDQTGLVTGVANGKTSVTAAVGGVSAAAVVSVSTPPWIVFSSFRDGNEEIYVMAPNGSNQTRLTNRPGDDSHPKASPDGRRIVFTYNDGTGRHVWMMNRDGTGLVQVTAASQDDYEPSWSPDGSRIVFRRVFPPSSQLFIMNANGSNPVQITNTYGDKIGPVWSPAGQRIAYGTNADGTWEVYLVNEDGSGITRITTGPGSSGWPSWSPDGQRIAFANDRSGSLQIHLMYADGTWITQLTNLSGGNHSSSWSADGTAIVWSSGAAGNEDIWSMNADGSGVRQLTTSATTDRFPSWLN